VISCSPRLRSDLTLSRQETAGGNCLVVKDPVSGRFYRFREAERFVAEQLDGDTSLDVVRQRTEREFGASLPAEMLKAFVQKLNKAGLLETGNAPSERRNGYRDRVRGSLLYLRFSVFDPDRLFTHLHARVRFLFTPHFVVLSVGVILLAMGTALGNGPALARDISALWHLSALPPFLALVLILVSAHEFAHGMTCKHFGGEVHEVGFMLIYFQPAFYCNVSDAWLFPEKSKRLWVGFAGFYFELFLWALAALIWRVTEGGTWINETALMVVAISGFKTILDLNPFLKLDGYYLLSDYLEIPNLRRRSFRYVGGVIKRLFGLGPDIAAATPPRERMVYLAYGLVGTVSSFTVLSYALAKLGGYLLDARQPMTLLVSAALVGMKVRRRFRRLFGKPSGASDPADDGDDGDDGGDVETSASGLSPEPVEPGKKMSRSRKRWILGTALAGGATAVMLLGRVELRIGGPVNILPEENADVRAAVEGIIAEIRVDEGDTVRAGAVIARLSDNDLRPELLKTEAAVSQSRANLRKLEAGPTAEEIAVARASVSRAEDAVKFAESKLAREKSLLAREAVTLQEVEAAEEQATMAAKDLADAKARLDVLLHGTRPEDIDATRAQVDGLETQRRYLEEQLRLLTVVSPVAGIVATPSRELHEMRGQLVTKGALIAKVYDVNTVTVQITIPEKEIADVHVGQGVVLRSRAYPDASFHGTVTAIATAAEGSSSAGGAPAAKSSSSSVGGTFIVTTQIDNHSLLLKPGMTGQAKISCGKIRIVDLVRRRLARTLKVEFWSWW